MINHPIKKFFADMFYVNDVLNFKKDCCRDPHGECHGWRTTFKWILLLTKGFFFSFIILFVRTTSLTCHKDAKLTYPILHS